MPTKAFERLLSTDRRRVQPHGEAPYGIVVGRKVEERLRSCRDSRRACRFDLPGRVEAGFHVFERNLVVQNTAIADKAVESLRPQLI